MVPKVIAYLLFTMLGFHSALFLQEDVPLFIHRLSRFHDLQIGSFSFLKVGSSRFAPYASSPDTEKGLFQLSHLFGEFLSSEHLLEVWL